MSNYDVIVVGTACCDIIFHGLPSFPKLGEEVWTEGIEVTAGGAMNTPAALSRLGVNTGLITPIGTDIWGEIILSKIIQEGILTELLYHVNQAFPQVSVALNYNNDRSFVSYGEKPDLKAYQKHIQQVIHQHSAQFFHFNSSPEEGHTELMKEAKNVGKKISLDIGWDPEWLVFDKAREQIAIADIFLPNLKEAQLITGKEDKYDALEALAKIVPTVVIKLGADGAICFSEGKVYESRSKAIKSVDATGAGDCFVAGFLYGWLNNKTTQECLQIGNYCGGSSVTAVGGYKGVPLEADVKDFINTMSTNKCSLQ
jgi:sugar/nucleoside kinase (ribokinase family)